MIPLHFCFFLKRKVISIRSKTIGILTRHPHRYHSKKQATQSRVRVIMSAITATAALNIQIILVLTYKCTNEATMISMML